MSLIYGGPQLMGIFQKPPRFRFPTLHSRNSSLTKLDVDIITSLSVPYHAADNPESVFSNHPQPRNTTRSHYHAASSG